MLTTREKGNIGEEIACNYLQERGFLVQERNYLKKWGEIDIIAIKDGKINFFEIKSTTANKESGYRPEENVHDLKVKRLKRTLQTYLNERKFGNDTEFYFHVLIVKFKQGTRKTEVTMLENIIL